MTYYINIMDALVAERSLLATKQLGLMEKRQPLSCHYLSYLSLILR
jgi:hypothetical protein